MTITDIKTIADLKKADYKVLSVREEIRKNLIVKMETNQPIFPGILGYNTTVIPQIQNAIIAGQDIIFLGERGQGKSRLIRSLADLLDEFIPTIAGCEINDNPFDPLCSQCRSIKNEKGDETEIVWLERNRRYGEKLATPDISIADLIGEIDPIKIAEGKYLSDELTIHYGLIPRVNRGIFCINEIPDLAERIQVGLLNLMEERDIQVRGFKMRLPLDIFVVASANPEDYTNRGRIITPLKDRYGAQIRTHYPFTVNNEILIAEQEQVKFKDHNFIMPKFMAIVLAKLTMLCRHSAEINQRSGVSVRLSIANYETLGAASIVRSIINHEEVAVPRISDLNSIRPSTIGKLEFEIVEDGKEEAILSKLLETAIIETFNEYFQDSDLDLIINDFDQGLLLETGNDMPSSDYKTQGIDSKFTTIMGKLEDLNNDAMFASSLEFLLEGLYLTNKIGRSNANDNKTTYKTKKTT